MGVESLSGIFPALCGYSPDQGQDMAVFDKDRFEALVLHIAHRRRDDEAFGRTKLAKVLFYSDFGAYQDTGKPLTGATYIRMPFGPFPKQLKETENSLAERKLVLLAHDVEDDYAEKRMIPLKASPDLGSVFEPWQVSFVDTWIERIASASARQISELSHHHPGWLLAEDRGEIPYETAILPEERPSGIQASRAKGVARERGWYSPAGKWKWERSPS